MKAADEKDTKSQKRETDLQIKTPALASHSNYRPTDTGPHIHGGHEPIKTQAAIVSRDVAALASVADVWSLLTLIDI